VSQICISIAIEDNVGNGGTICMCFSPFQVWGFQINADNSLKSLSGSHSKSHINRRIVCARYSSSLSSLGTTSEGEMDLQQRNVIQLLECRLLPVVHMRSYFQVVYCPADFRLRLIGRFFLLFDEWDLTAQADVRPTPYASE